MTQEEGNYARLRRRSIGKKKGSSLQRRAPRNLVPKKREIQEIDIYSHVKIACFSKTKLRSVRYVSDPREAFTAAKEEAELSFVAVAIDHWVKTHTRFSVE